MLSNEEKVKNIRISILTLHKYFIWSDRMRVHFYKTIEGGLPINDPNVMFSKKGINANLYMSYWYASMFVVIEGWQQLGLSDPKIDNLLKSPNVKLLKHYRHGVFHFQRNYFDKRFIELIRDGQNAVKWIRDLREEFSRFFLDWFKQNGK